MKVLKGILAFLLIVAIGVGIGWLASRRPSPPPENGVQQSGAKSDTTAPRQPAALVMSTKSAVTNEVPNPFAGDIAEEEEVSTNPDDKIDDILGEVTAITNVVKNLIELYPKLSNAGKLEAVEHLTMLVPDEDYEPLAKILMDKEVLPAVSSELLTDLIDRPNDVKMPLMLSIARDPKHPGAKEAKENLELLIEPEEELGDDWDKWEKAMEEWVKENPE